VESIIIHKVGDRGTFIKNLDAFQENGHISHRQRGNIDAVLGAGHAAIHRSWQPSKEQIETILDITEKLVEEIYLHEPRADRLDRKVPKRPPKS
jgi:hypothetical protein